MDSQITRLVYEAPKLEGQELLPQVYATAQSQCVSSPNGDPSNDIAVVCSDPGA